MCTDVFLLILCGLIVLAGAYALFLYSEFYKLNNRHRKYFDGNIIIFIGMILVEGLVIFSIPSTLGEVKNKKAGFRLYGSVWNFCTFLFNLLFYFVTDYEFFFISIVTFLLSSAALTPIQLSVASVLLNLNICLFVDSMCFSFFYSSEMRNTIPIKLCNPVFFFTLFQSNK